MEEFDSNSNHVDPHMRDGEVGLLLGLSEKKKHYYQEMDEGDAQSEDKTMSWIEEIEQELSIT